MSRKLRRRWQFFFKNAGYIVGHAALCALKLAKAEEHLEAAVDTGEARVRWEMDEWADLSWADERELALIRSGALQVRCCLLETRCTACKRWETSASLFGIVSAFDNLDHYPRVVEAELALEVF